MRLQQVVVQVELEALQLLLEVGWPTAADLHLTQLSFLLPPEHQIQNWKALLLHWHCHQMLILLLSLKMSLEELPAGVLQVV